MGKIKPYWQFMNDAIGISTQRLKMNSINENEFGTWQHSGRKPERSDAFVYPLPVTLDTTSKRCTSQTKARTSVVIQACAQNIKWRRLLVSIEEDREMKLHTTLIVAQDPSTAGSPALCRRRFFFVRSSVCVSLFPAYLLPVYHGFWWACKLCSGASNFVKTAPLFWRSSKMSMKDRVWKLIVTFQKAKR